MRWNKSERRPRTYWRPYFAILPVRLENTGQWVWLEWIWWNEGTWDFPQRLPRYRDDIGWHCANLSFEDRK